MFYSVNYMVLTLTPTIYSFSIPFFHKIVLKSLNRKFFFSLNQGFLRIRIFCILYFEWKDGIHCQKSILMRVDMIRIFISVPYIYSIKCKYFNMGGGELG